MQEVLASRKNVTFCCVALTDPARIWRCFRAPNTEHIPFAFARHLFFAGRRSPTGASVLAARDLSNVLLRTRPAFHGPGRDARALSLIAQHRERRDRYPRRESLNSSLSGGLAGRDARHKSLQPVSCHEQMMTLYVALSPLAGVMSISGASASLKYWPRRAALDSSTNNAHSVRERTRKELSAARWQRV